MIEDAEKTRSLVREKYGAIAREGNSCCSSNDCSTGVVDMIGDAYQAIDGYVTEADLGLGCGVPTEHAGIAPGDTVLDLGAGAGIDAFVARNAVGETGKIYGVDMTPDMVARARANAEQLGYRNVEFRLGEIEHLPFERDSIDVVISNCVLNLVPDKAQAFAEIFRVLRPGGHFCISDIVASAPLPEKIRKEATLYVGCVAGAETEARYVATIRDAGFHDIHIVKSRRINLPESGLPDSLGSEEIVSGQTSDLHVRSVTVVAVKPTVA